MYVFNQTFDLKMRGCTQSKQTVWNVGMELVKVAEIQDVNSATSAAAASTNISIPADLVAPNSLLG